MTDRIDSQPSEKGLGVWTISTRLTLWYGASLLVFLSVFVILLYTAFHLNLHREFEQQLARDAFELRASIRFIEGEPVLDTERALQSVALGTSGVSGTYARLFNEKGVPVYIGPNAQMLELPEPILEGVDSDDVSDVHRSGPIPMLSRTMPLEATETAVRGWLEVSRIESQMHRNLHRFRWMLGVGVLLGVLVSGWVGLAMARRALRPVSDLTQAAQKIQAEKLENRLPTRFGVRDELTDLAETMNDLLDRLDRSFERERQFRADAAHEMFTPISALRSEIEVALRRERSLTEYQDTLGTLGEHADRLSAIVDDLLRLSRAETSSNGTASKVDLSRAIAESLARASAKAEAAEVTVISRESPQSGPLSVCIDPSHLEVILDNLVDNAIKYSPCGSIVTVSFGRRGNWIVFQVEDAGVGFTTEDGVRLFDRFFRSENQRVRSIKGSGLGLSIVKAFVEGCGGKIRAESNGSGRGSRFIVHLPANQGT